MLLLTLAKHSDNYFCWFQIAFSSRVWSQQVFFACWACLFRHPKSSKGKDDGFFSFLSTCTLAFPEQTFCFESKGEAHKWEVGWWSWRKTELGHPYLKVPTHRNRFSCPCWKPQAFPSAHNTPREDRSPPTPPWSCMTTQPEISALVFLLSNAPKSTVPSRSP